VCSPFIKNGEMYDGNHIDDSNILEIFKDQLSQNGFNLDNPIQTNLFLVAFFSRPSGWFFSLKQFP
jgi:hypothetical protein